MHCGISILFEKLFYLVIFRDFMRINQDLRIKSGRTGLELVPYGAHHVEKYHKWMEDEELRRYIFKKFVSFLILEGN